MNHGLAHRTGRTTLSSPSLFRRLQGKKSGARTSNESLASSLPPPRHAHRRTLSRRPVVIYYATNPEADLPEGKRPVPGLLPSDLADDEVATPGSSTSIEWRDDRLEDATARDLASSSGPREHLSRSCGPGRALLRMSQTFGRASERADPVSAGDGRHRGATRKSVKYDVAWQGDDESACCQVCFAMFTTLSRRRHHCRVCGELVCGACSQDQVALVDKFPTPRRACVACSCLLQAMARAGDARVNVVEADVVPVPAITRHKSVPLATPRYRDRLNEVHRVMAAGKLSRRRGSAEKKMYVISSRWLRRWLAFTSSASSRSDATCSPDFGFDTETSPSSPHNDKSGTKCAPGPIDNLSLLILSRGKLLRRPGLIRDATYAGDVASVGEDADYQLLSPEVWDVFQRLYGGTPAIYVNLTSDDPTAWVVDVATLLAPNLKEGLAPTVERALLTRHCGQVATGTPAAVTPRDSLHQSPKSPAWTATNSSVSSVGEDKERVMTPLNSGHLEFEELESELATVSLKPTKKGEDEGRATLSGQSPTAVLAASAFAVAMKQARLNAQKAIDDRASRVLAA